jgi:lipid-binding SYLF domain-containing protein
MKTLAAALLASSVLLIALPACSTAPKTTEGRSELDTQVAAAMNTFRARDSGLNSFLAKARGYAIFPSVGKGAVAVGGAYGKGELFEMGKKVGYCDLTQASIGLALGGQSYSELIVFESEHAIDRFKDGKFTFAAQASAVALKSGTTADAKYADGVAVFSAGQAGLMYEASIGGQKFSYNPL